MDKKTILDLLMQNAEKNKIQYSEDDLELLSAIKDAITEMEVARSLFNSVSDPQLIELAIHAEDVAKTRYDYLISMAKRRELRKIN
ncbi:MULTISPECIES: DUF2508 family protein [unclassified Clostridium]|uniref:DUF2508 family protein n=1 Tax=unclassified Clostridium TaxID=2614128 RepID=UPI0018985056|nr:MULTISPECIES: DUF2508 family protein [unclassified Clostridium]MCR1951999.1 YaaL family protein [Clostridium sp. DSM 100503]